MLSPESLRQAGYFDPGAVASARQRLATMRRGLGRTSLEMGLTAVTATQLWHHLYVSGDLCAIGRSGQWAVGSGQGRPPAVRGAPTAVETR